MGCNKSKIDTIHSGSHNETVQSIVSDSPPPVITNNVNTELDSTHKEEFDLPKEEGSGCNFFKLTLDFMI